MPNKFVTLDTGFPTFSDKASTTEKVDGIMSYLYQMQESLRYMFRHLDSENFDEAGLRSITEPISIMLREDYNSTEIEITPAGIEAIVEGLESTLNLYVKSDTFNTTIEALDKDISEFDQTLKSISLSVTSSEGEATKFVLTAGETTLSTPELFIWTDAAHISGQLTADQIAANAITTDKIAANAVTANEIAANTITGNQIAANTIEGKNIKANTINGNRLIAGTVAADILRGQLVALEYDGTTMGYLDIANTTTGGGLGLRTSSGGIKVEAGGNVYLRAWNGTGAMVQLTAGAVTLAGALVLGGASYGPLSNRPATGVSGQVYFATST